MIFLSSDSSTLLGSVALFKDDKLLAFRESQRQGSHTNVINFFVDQVLVEANLKLSDIDLFVSGVGPGSFTGIRISLNMMKTFAYCYDKPVLGINSLENLAAQAAETSLPIVCMINAYKNMVYIARYKKSSKGLVEIAEPQVVRVQNLSEFIKAPCIVVGDGYETYEKYFPETLKALINRPLSGSDDPRAQAMGNLVINRYQKESVHWSQFMPLYLRASEAEEVQQGIKFQPLV